MSTPSWKVKALVTWSYPSLCNSMDCSPPGSSVQGILQARILEWITIPFSRGSSQPRDQTCVSGIVGKFFTLPPQLKNRLKKCFILLTWLLHRTQYIHYILLWKAVCMVVICIGSEFTLLISRSQLPASSLILHKLILLPDMGFICKLERILSVSVQSGDRNYIIIWMGNVLKKEWTIAGYWSKERMTNRKHKDLKGQRNSTNEGQPSGWGWTSKEAVALGLRSRPRERTHPQLTGWKRSRCSFLLVWLAENPPSATYQKLNLIGFQGKLFVRRCLNENDPLEIFFYLYILTPPLHRSFFSCSQNNCILTNPVMLLPWFFCSVSTIVFFSC